MKEDLEHIWKNEPLAYPCNITGWSKTRPVININRANMKRFVSFRLLKFIYGFYARKCKRNK